MAELGRHIQSQQHQLERQQKEFAQFHERLTALEEAFYGPPPALDPVQQWMKANRAEISKYRGKRIAVHPERGIIAFADTYSSLEEQLRNTGIADDVVIEFIPHSYPAK